MRGKPRLQALGHGEMADQLACWGLAEEAPKWALSFRKCLLGTQSL